MFVKHTLWNIIRETGYRGNAVSSSVKNSVGERQRTEMERREERVGVGAGAG